MVTEWRNRKHISTAWTSSWTDCLRPSPVTCFNSVKKSSLHKSIIHPTGGYPRDLENHRTASSLEAQVCEYFCSWLLYRNDLVELYLSPLDRWSNNLRILCYYLQQPLNTLVLHYVHDIHVVTVAFNVASSR